MKKAALILFLLLAAGCGSTLKHSWNNFTAYYNTFYNARKSFKAGLEKVKRQPIQIHPDSLVQLYPTPLLAGKDDFQSAIRNAAQLLRRFPTSKWTDDALMLMGKSYYFLHDFFKANKKFEEVLAISEKNSMRQQAIIWKSRTLIEIHSYSAGVQFLQKKLTALKGKWNPQKRAITRSLLGEYQAILGNKDDAVKNLTKALPNIKNRSLHGRASFLLGQLFQKMGDYNKAFKAFSRVKKYHPDYVYIYWANIKRAKTARLAGHIKQAIFICSSMIKNSKNFNDHNEIYYQQALNNIAEDMYQQAKMYFQKILANHGENSPNHLRHKSYYRLGRLYGQHLDNYSLAEAYFDSASVYSSSRLRSRGNRKTQNLARAYQRYDSLKKDIQLADSLLKLGSLSKRELRKKLIIIQKRQQNLEKGSESIQSQHTISNSSSARKFFHIQRAKRQISTFGFLNYKNPKLVTRERILFISVWGRRPLVDNWRREQAITGTKMSQNAGKSAQAGSSKFKIRKEVLQHNLQKQIEANIPKTAAASRKLRRRQMKDQYLLGNLFFLDINQPDSASFYYRKALEQQPPPYLKMKTWYSLTQLLRINHQPDSASFYETKILRQFPASTFASHILKRTGKTTQNLQNHDDTAMNLVAKVHRFKKQHPAAGNKKTAHVFQHLAMNYKQEEAAPAVYLEGIRSYINFVKSRDTLQISRDSLNTASEKKLASKTHSGSYWDTVRTMLADFKKTFPDAPQLTKVEVWEKMLKRPSQNKSIKTCKELGVKPEILPSEKRFIQRIKLPEKLKRLHLSGTIRFRIVIGKDGSVKSYKLLSPPTHLGIEPAYGSAIKNSLHFKPIKQHGKPIQVSCDFDFPIK